MVTNLLPRLCDIVGAEHAFSGGGERYRLGRLAPALVARPADEGQVSRVLATAAEAGLAVVPWGSGQHQGIGARPARFDLALDLTRLDRILAHEPADLTVTVQAGMRLGTLQQHLEGAAQIVALDPPGRTQATLGGILAANLSGPLRCRYGTARDLVLGVRVAEPDGTVVKAGARVVKNATAYDLTKLHIGAHGTLGVLLEATLRLFPRPEAERGWWIATTGVAPGQAAAFRMLGSHLAPNRMELLDPGAAAAMGLPGATAGLLLSCAGIPEAIDAQEVEIDRGARESAGRMDRVEDARVWGRLADFPWLPVEGHAHHALWRASVLPSECGKAMEAVEAAADKHRARTAIAATIVHGVMRGRVVGETAESLAAGLAAARQAIVGLGGFLVILEAPDAVRDRLGVWGAEPEAVEAMRRLKRAFDPQQVLNPGRFVGGI